MDYSRLRSYSRAENIVTHNDRVRAGYTPPSSFVVAEISIMGWALNERLQSLRLAGPAADVIHPRFLFKSHSLHPGCEPRSAAPPITPYWARFQGHHAIRMQQDTARIVRHWLKLMQHALQLHQEVNASVLYHSTTRWYITVDILYDRTTMCRKANCSFFELYSLIHERYL